MMINFFFCQWYNIIWWFAIFTRRFLCVRHFFANVIRKNSFMENHSKAVQFNGFLVCIQYYFILVNDSHHVFLFREGLRTLQSTYEQLRASVDSCAFTRINALLSESWSPKMCPSSQGIAILRSISWKQNTSRETRAASTKCREIIFCPCSQIPK